MAVTDKSQPEKTFRFINQIQTNSVNQIKWFIEKIWPKKQNQNIQIHEQLIQDDCVSCCVNFYDYHSFHIIKLDSLDGRRKKKKKRKNKEKHKQTVTF